MLLAVWLDSHLLYRKHHFIHGQVKMEEQKIKEGDDQQRSCFSRSFFFSIVYIFVTWAHFIKLRLNDKWSITATSDLGFSNPHFAIFTDLQSFCFFF